MAIDHTLVAAMLDGMAQQAEVDARTNFTGDEREALLEAARQVSELAVQLRGVDGTR